MGRVAQRGRKAPAVSFRGRRRSPRLSHGDADRAVGSVVIEILDLTLQLFDLSRDLADLILHRDDVVDVLRLGQQRKHRVVLSFGVGEPGAKVYVLGAHVAAGDVLALHLADLRELVDGRVEVRGWDHEVDDPGSDLAGLAGRLRARLGVGAGDEAALRLDQGADLRELRVKGT